MFKDLYSNASKGNNCVEKSVYTGVFEISWKGMLSDLNNLTKYDIYSEVI